MNATRPHLPGRAVFLRYTEGPFVLERSQALFDMLYVRSRKQRTASVEDLSPFFAVGRHTFGTDMGQNVA